MLAEVLKAHQSSEAWREELRQSIKESPVNSLKSWYCHPCAVEVYQARCPHCGKTKKEKS